MARQKPKKISDTVKFAIVGAFSLVIALAWNEAIKSFFDEVIVPLVAVPGTGYVYKAYLAIAVTIIAAAGIWFFTQRFNSK